MAVIVRALVAVALLCGVLAIGAGTSSAAAEKVSVCHLTRAGNFVHINVAEAAHPAHVDHGDASPGEAVPGMGGFQFGENCQVTETTCTTPATVSGVSDPVEFFGYVSIVPASHPDVAHSVISPFIFVGGFGPDVDVPFTFTVPASFDDGTSTWQLPATFYVGTKGELVQTSPNSYIAVSAYSNVFTLDCGDTLTGVVLDQDTPPDPV